MTFVPIADLFREAERLEATGQSQLAANLYKGWLALNPDDGLRHAAYFNYSVALSRNGDRAGAINALRECIRLKPDFYPPYLNLGRLLEDSGQAGAAIAQWNALVQSLTAVSGEAVRSKLMVLQQMGRVLENAHADALAEDALRQSLDLDLHQPEVAQHWIALRQRQCKWPVIETWEGVAAKRVLANISPLSTAVMLDDPMYQLARGYQYARQSIGIAAALTPQVPRLRMPDEKLRIGYLSSDLREHAVGFGIAEVMELHDRSRHVIHAYYCGVARPDPTQARIRAGVDSWVDINGLDDDAAAQRIAADGIDILIDLNGYTRDARTAVLARRPAPVIVNWYGFPGSMGTPYHHYIVGDPVVIPEGDEIYYSEKVLRLACYQPNDRKRPVAEIPARRDEGLPDDAFVFCCLNGSQKLTPAVFAIWMQILDRVPGGVLWLLGATAETNARLRQMAHQLGVDPARLVFADKKPNPEHLARYRLADLFLDTFPYGAHTTASDALFMGVPVLTMPGRSFASRVCAGLVQAAGLGDLVCASLAEYVERAVAIGHDRTAAAALSRRLAAGRESCLLFNTPRLVRDLEHLFADMWADYEAGCRPRPNLTNLDAYAEIGTELNLESLQGRAGSPSPERYAERLAAWDRGYPLPADGRLWYG
jgi:predicted O-linked N-acetylglucosamine transferase (SPINDLY family)